MVDRASRFRWDFGDRLQFTDLDTGEVSVVEDAAARDDQDFEESKHPRDEDGKFAKPGNSTELEVTEQRAWRGKSSATAGALPKTEIGAIGEDVAVRFLRAKGFDDVKGLHAGVGHNFALDLVGDHELFEVKTGIASSTTPRWRITIGQPGKAETAWLKTAGPEEKRAWNKQKVEMAIARKQEVLAKFAEELGLDVRPKTVGIIIDPETGVADVHLIDGFHADVGWNSDTVKKAYVGSFKYR